MSPLVEAFLLGILQGLTEFLPVSSSGHLALAQMLMGVKEPGVTLSVVMHAGTFVATCLLVRQRLRLALQAFLQVLSAPRSLTLSEGGRDVLVVILVTIPTGIIGVVFRDTIQKYSASPYLLGCGFLITSALLVSTYWFSRGERDVPTYWGALLVGIAQGVAIFPGISRSGTTIAVLLWLGVRSKRSFELSMLMSLPVVLGAMLIEARHLHELEALGYAFIGACVAFLFGLVALLMLRKIVVNNWFAWFAVWVFPLGILTLWLASSGVI